MFLVDDLASLAVLIDFLVGVVVGLFGSVALASRWEDRRYSLLSLAPDPLCDGARVFQGVYTRGEGVLLGRREGDVGVSQAQEELDQ